MSNIDSRAIDEAIRQVQHGASSAQSDPMLKDTGSNYNDSNTTYSQSKQQDNSWLYGSPTSPSKIADEDTYKAIINAKSRQPWGTVQNISRDRVEYQMFPEDYFSGSDVVIYMGDVFVSDISRISFQIQENVRPIFGYSSYTWDEVARGQRIVQGQFVIPFREAGYIHTILGHIGQLGGSADVQRPMIARLMNEAENTELVNASKPPGFIADVAEDIKTLLTRHHGQNSEGISQGITGDYAVMQYENRVADYEREIWGRSVSADMDRRYQTYFYVDRTNASDGVRGTNMLQWQEVFKVRGPSIHITYGPVNGALYDDYAMVKKGFRFNYTVKALHNIQFTGISQTIDATGTPIEEIYSFIAQDID